MEENMPWLFKLVRSKLRNPDIAEDLVQEIWIKAFKAYENYYEEGKLKHWLMRIAQNHLRSYFSESNRVYIFSLDAGLSDDDDSFYDYLSDGQTPENEYLQKETLSRVLEVISQLPDRQKKVITFRFINNFTVEETAQAMQIPLETVKSATHYALGEIKKQFKE